MPAVIDIQVTNEPLRIGFPGSHCLVIHYYLDCMDIEPGQTQLVLTYDISANLSNICFADGTRIHETRITLFNNTIPDMQDTLLFLRRGESPNPPPMFAMQIRPKLLPVDDLPFQPLDVFVSI